MNQSYNHTFESAVNFIHNTKKLEIDNNTKLEFYGLYKQSTIGDCNLDCPSILNYPQYCKWNAWNNLKGKKSFDAKKEYVLKLINMDCGYNK